VKLVDTQDLKSCAFNGRAGSIPAPGTKQNKSNSLNGCFFCACKRLIGEIDTLIISYNISSILPNITSNCASNCASTINIYLIRPLE
jgi:hypothetical protein